MTSTLGTDTDIEPTQVPSGVLTPLSGLDVSTNVSPTANVPDTPYLPDTPSREQTTSPYKGRLARLHFPPDIIHNHDTTHVRKLTLPPGFNGVMTELSREVLREQPNDIVVFAALYFEKELQKRQNPRSAFTRKNPGKVVVTYDFDTYGRPPSPTQVTTHDEVECTKKVSEYDFTLGDAVGVHVSEDALSHGEGDMGQPGDVTLSKEEANHTDEPSDDPGPEEAVLEEQTSDDPSPVEAVQEQQSSDDPSTEEAAPEQQSSDDPSTEEAVQEQQSNDDPNPEEAAQEQQSSDDPSTEEAVQEFIKLL